MTTESDQLDAQSREAVIAHLIDPSVQLECKYKDGIEWQTSYGPRTFDLDNFYYRIAKPKKWYRVAKMKFHNGEEYPEVASHMDEEPVEKLPGFIKWLDERKYYD